MSAALPSVNIPRLNPIRLYNVLNQKAFAEEFTIGYTPAKYDQIFSRFDTLAFQIKVEGAGQTVAITCKAYDINELLAYTFTVTPIYVGSGTGLNGYLYYEVREVLTVLPAGVYRIVVTVKNYTDAIPAVLMNEFEFNSEPIYLQDSFENSVILKYGHDGNDKDLLFVDPDTFAVTGVTTPLAARQEYINIGTYNTHTLYRAGNNDHLLFYATTLQGGSKWVIQANATTTPNEAASNYTYHSTITGTYTNVGSWAGTTEIDYSHNYFYHRVLGGFDTNDFDVSSQDVVYRDQPYSLTQLDSITFDNTKITFGDGRGIPNWQAAILNHIFGCDEIHISGYQFVKNESKFEKVSDKNWPMMGWKLDVAPGEILMSDTFNGYDYNDDYYYDFLINI